MECVCMFLILITLVLDYIPHGDMLSFTLQATSPEETLNCNKAPEPAFTKEGGLSRVV